MAQTFTTPLLERIKEQVNTSVFEGKMPHEKGGVLTNGHIPNAFAKEAETHPDKTHLFKLFYLALMYGYSCGFYGYSCGFNCAKAICESENDKE